MKYYLLLLVVGILATQGDAQKPELRGASSSQHSESLREKMSGLAEKLGLASRVREQGAEVNQQQGLYGRNQELGMEGKRAYEPREVVPADVRQQNLEAYRDSVSSKVDQLSRAELMKFSEIFEAPEEQDIGKQYDQRGRPFQQAPAEQTWEAPLEQAPAESPLTLEELDKYGDKFTDVKAKLKPHGKEDRESKGGRRDRDQDDRRLQAVVAGVNPYADPYYGGAGIAGVGVAGVGLAGVDPYADPYYGGAGIAGVGVAGVANPFAAFNAGLPNNLRYYGGCYQQLVARYVSACLCLSLSVCLPLPLLLSLSLSISVCI